MNDTFSQVTIEDHKVPPDVKEYFEPVLCGECYVCKIIEVFREVRRVLRPDASCWINLGDSFQDKQLVGIPWRVAFALQADGWWLRSDIIWSKPNPMPESVTDRPTKAHEYLFLLSPSQRYYYDADAVREGNAGKLPYGDKHNFKWNDEQAQGRHGKNSMFAGGTRQEYIDKYYVNGRNRRTVWHIATKPYSGAHFATYPPALVEPCIKAGTSERGVCPECGMQWKRVVEKSTRYEGGSGKAGRTADEIGGKWGDSRHGENILLGPVVDTTTLGWRPACDHYPRTDEWQEYPPQGYMSDEVYQALIKPIQNIRHELLVFWQDMDTEPAVILDPFSGAATTGLVCQQLNRRYVGLDLSAEYHQLARKRLSLDKWDEWKNGTQAVEANLDGLPMFE